MKKDDLFNKRKFAPRFKKLTPYQISWHFVPTATHHAANSQPFAEANSQPLKYKYKTFNFRQQIIFLLVEKYTHLWFTELVLEIFFIIPHGKYAKNVYISKTWCQGLFSETESDL